MMEGAFGLRPRTVLFSSVRTGPYAKAGVCVRLSASCACVCVCVCVPVPVPIFGLSHLAEAFWCSGSDSGGERTPKALPH